MSPSFLHWEESLYSSIAYCNKCLFLQFYSSDSDSEMEMRLREAAVSVTDLLSAALPSAVTHSLPESPSSEKIMMKNKKGDEAEREDHNNSPVPKKRKALQGECGEVEHCGESSPNAKTDEEQKRPEEDIIPLKKKKKKKKAQMIDGV